jgi:hypothetical protein
MSTGGQLKVYLKKTHQTLKVPAINFVSVALKLVCINNEGKVKPILRLICNLKLK